MKPQEEYLERFNLKLLLYCPMEAFAYVLILTLAVVTLFFAVAFRDPPKWDQKDR